MNSNKLKIVTILGTRPEIRLSSIIKKFDKYFDHKVISTNQNYDKNLNKIFLRDLNLRDYDFKINSFGKTPIETISKIIFHTEKILKKIRPDGVFILGDTNSSLSAITARKNKIPIFHYEAGNRCYDYNTPEEVNRKIVDHISDINFTYSNLSRENLIHEGLKKNRVISIGSPLPEVFNDNFIKIDKSTILKKLDLKKNEFFLISFHRQENLDSTKLQSILDILHKLTILKKFKIVVSTHPRTKLKIFNNKIFRNKNIIFSEPFNYSDYNALQKNSFYVLSDSGSINEEASILKFDAINLRSSHERPESDSEAVTIMSLNSKVIIELIKLKFKGEKRNFNSVDSYENKNISDKLVSLVISYLNYLNYHKG